MRGLIRRIGLPPAALWLLAGTLVTTIGNGMHTLAIGMLLYDHTGSVAAFGAVMIFEQVVSFLMQLVAGPWVDRGDPKRTSVQVEVFRGVMLIALAAGMLVVTKHLIALVMLMTLIIKVVQPFYRAATFALAPAVMPDDASLSRYNAFSNVCLQVGYFIGVALAGVVLELWTPTIAFLINGVTFLLSALTIVFIAVPKDALPPVAEKAEAAWKQLVTGWKEIVVLVRKETSLGWHLVLSTVDSVSVLLFNLVLVQIIAERYAGSAYWLSVVDGGFAVGAIVTAALVTPLMNRWGSRFAAIIGMGGQAACFVLLGLTDNGWATLLLSFGIGAFNTISWTVIVTTLQLRVDKSVKGRIGTVRNLLTALLGSALVPVVSKTATFSLEGALIVSGGICAAFTLIAMLFGRSRTAGSTLLGEQRSA